MSIEPIEINLSKKDKLEVISKYEKEYYSAQVAEEKAEVSLKIGLLYYSLNNFSKAKIWLEKSKMYGSDEAICKLGWMYCREEIVGNYNSKEMAKRLFDLAISHGFGEGYFGLACMYFDECDVDYAFAFQTKAKKFGYDMHKSLSFKNQSAENREIFEYYESAVNSEGEDSISYLFKAACGKFKPAFDDLYVLTKNDDPIACYYMGQLLEKIGRSRTHIQAACDYYDKASKIGCLRADSRRNIIGKIINKEDTCPKCGSALVLRSNPRGGWFKACVSRSCDYTTHSSEYQYSTTYSTEQLFLDYMN